jgi:tripartite-type tricarboxylate transporter receptor subunit TctC
MSPGLVGTLNTVFAAAVRDIDAEGRLAQIGVEPVSEAPQQFADYAARYVARNAELLKTAKFEPV